MINEALDYYGMGNALPDIHKLTLDLCDSMVVDIQASLRSKGFKLPFDRTNSDKLIQAWRVVIGPIKQEWDGYSFRLVRSWSVDGPLPHKPLMLDPRTGQCALCSLSELEHHLLEKQ